MHGGLLWICVSAALAVRRFPYCNLCAIKAAQTGTRGIDMNSLSEFLPQGNYVYFLGIFIFPIIVSFLGNVISNSDYYSAINRLKLTEFSARYHVFWPVRLLHTLSRATAFERLSGA
ncbi:hypothetical protein [Ferrovibrio sp.]|uniref:hypothetical protein n=1 Tax=Ferrovibrio sp. TaxID=1917215 RepID=UPI0035B181C1